MVDIVTLPDGSVETTYPSGHVEVRTKRQVLEQNRVAKLREVSLQAKKEYLADEPPCGKTCVDYSKCPCHKCAEMIRANPQVFDLLTDAQKITLETLWNDKTGYLGVNGCKIAETLGREYMPLGCLTFICPWDTNLDKYDT